MNSAKKFYQNIGIAVILLALGLCAEAATIAGRVLAVSGQVVAIGVDQRDLRRGSELFEGDRVQTGTDSSAQIQLVDGELMALGPDSSLIIEQHSYDPAQKEGKKILNLTTGVFRTVTGAIKDNYQVKSGALTLGIRGTEYGLSYINNVVAAGVWQGAITVNANDNSMELCASCGFSFATVVEGQLEGTLEPPAVLEQFNAAVTRSGEEVVDEKALEADEPSFKSRQQGENEDDFEAADEFSPESRLEDREMQDPETADLDLEGELDFEAMLAVLAEALDLSETEVQTLLSEIELDDVGEELNDTFDLVVDLEEDPPESDSDPASASISGQTGFIVIANDPEATEEELPGITQGPYYGPSTDASEGSPRIRDNLGPTDGALFTRAQAPIGNSLDHITLADADDSTFYWGTWNASEESPALVVGEGQVLDPLYWVVGPATDSDNMPTTGSFSYGNTAMFEGLTSAGEISSGVASFTVDFDSLEVAGDLVFTDDENSWFLDVEGSVVSNSIEWATTSDSHVFTPGATLEVEGAGSAAFGGANAEALYGAFEAEAVADPTVFAAGTYITLQESASADTE